MHGVVVARRSSVRLLAVVALALVLGLAVFFVQILRSSRASEWNHARRTHANLAQAMQSTIERAIGGIDRSIVRVVDGLGQPDVMALPPKLRNGVLFDHTLRTHGVAGIAVLDVHGDIVADSVGETPRSGNFADRDYFRVFQQDPSRQDLYVGRPVQGRFSGRYIVPISRPHFTPDGRFAGVVVGGLHMSYVNELFSSVDLGPESGLALVHTDGTMLLRFPASEAAEASMARTGLLAQELASPAGDFSAPGGDGAEWLYAYRRVGRYPLIVHVEQSSGAIFASWRRNAWVVGLGTAALMVACVVLMLLFVRELRQRQAVGDRLREAEHHLRTIMNNLPSLVSYWDTDLRNRYANQAHVAWFGRTPEQLHNAHLRDVIGPGMLAQNHELRQRALQGEPQNFERTLVDVHGVERHCLVSYVPDREGEAVRGLFVQLTDITERRRVESELFEEKERMHLTLQSIADAVVCTDAQGLVTFLNPVAEHLTGWLSGQAQGRPAREVLQLEGQGGGAEGHLVERTLDPGAESTPRRGVLVRGNDGRRFQVEHSTATIRDAQGHAAGVVVVLHDVSEALAMAERMTHQAQYDALTDLPNRVLLQDRARQAMALAAREGRHLGVVYIDLDGFKQINDTLGHAAGDELLIQFARRLSSTIRQADTACRQGGDEFVLLLAGLDTEGAQERVAQKLLTVCQEPFVLAGQHHRIGLSGGLSLFPEHGASLDELSRHADAALYAAKRAGRGQVWCYAGEQQPPRLLARTGALSPVAGT